MPSLALPQYSLHILSYINLPSQAQVGNTDGATIAEENGVHDGLAPLICKEVGKV